MITQNSPQIVPQSQPPSTSISIETVENSIKNLIKQWDKRKRWQLFFHSTKQQEQQQKRAPWRIHLANFLESTPVRLVAISLLLIDLIFTVLELSASSLFSCKSSRSQEVEEIWFRWVGIGILSLLSLKSLVLVVALGGSFFRRPGFVVDGVVLMVALLLEAFLEKMGGGLVVVVSLWRVVRVVESAFELTDEAIEAQIEGILCQFQALKDENTRLLRVIDEKNEVIKKLQNEIDQCFRHAG